MVTDTYSNKNLLKKQTKNKNLFQIVFVSLYFDFFNIVKHTNFQQ
jgi:hypothetical protein